MKHLKLATRAPQTANINLDGFINAKVETKENVINAKAGAF
jgi:hypothetical protein